MKTRSATYDFFENLPMATLIGVTGLMPERARLGFAGWTGRQIIPRLEAQRHRALTNIGLVFPERSEAEREEIFRQMSAHIARSLVEHHHIRDLRSKASSLPIDGDGYEGLLAARDSGRGAVVVSGHFGQWEAPRALLTSLGIECAAVYKPYRNRYYDRAMRRAFARNGGPAFPTTRSGLRSMARHLAKGGFVAILVDQRAGGSPRLDFLGHPAETSTAAAELALKFKIPLMPGYGVRDPDGFGVRLVLENAVPPTTPEEMTQAINDSLSAQVRQHPEQYFWLHWRWGRPGRAGSPFT